MLQASESRHGQVSQGRSFTWTSGSPRNCGSEPTVLGGTFSAKTRPEKGAAQRRECPRFIVVPIPCCTNICSIESDMPIARSLPQPLVAVDEVSATEILTLAADALRTRRLAEVVELRLAIQWAVLHGHPRDERDPMVTPGGDGTPEVR